MEADRLETQAGPVCQLSQRQGTGQCPRQRAIKQKQLSHSGDSHLFTLFWPPMDGVRPAPSTLCFTGLTT